MRFAKHEGRLTLLGGGFEDERDGATGIDLHAASGGRIWPGLRHWGQFS